MKNLFQSASAQNFAQFLWQNKNENPGNTSYTGPEIVVYPSEAEQAERKLRMKEVGGELKETAREIKRRKRKELKNSYKADKRVGKTSFKVDKAKEAYEKAQREAEEARIAAGKDDLESNDSVESPNDNGGALNLPPLQNNETPTIPTIEKQQENSVEPDYGYQERSAIEETGERTRNEHDIKKIESREDSYKRASEVLENHFHPEKGGYDPNTIDWTSKDKISEVKALQYMLNFIHKYSAEYKGKIPSMFHTENIDGWLKDGNGISNTQPAIKQVNEVFGIETDNDLLNEITVSAELMTKLRAEVRRILEENKKDGTEVLDTGLADTQLIEKYKYVSSVLDLPSGGAVESKWFKFLDNITLPMAQESFDHDFNELGQYKARNWGSDSNLENLLEKGLEEDSAFWESDQVKTIAFIKWLGTDDGKEFRSGKNENTGDEWTNFGQYIQYKRGLDRRQAYVPSKKNPNEELLA